jgi:hypothetical protein
MSDDETAVAVRRTRSRHPAKLIWVIILRVKEKVTSCPNYLGSNNKELENKFERTTSSARIFLNSRFFI